MPAVVAGRAAEVDAAVELFGSFLRGAAHVDVGYALESRWTVSGENAGRQTAMYSAPSASGVL